MVKSAFDVDAVLDGIEKSLKLVATHSFNSQRFSTGLLTVDMILNGGIVPGGWYTFFGAEQSAKSTLAMTFLASITKTSVPILAYCDFEGSYQPDYFFNICAKQGIKNPKELFGIKHAKKSGYIKKPRIRYYAMGVGEQFFDYIAKLQRSLPDKLKEGDKYYYVFDNTKENRKKIGDTPYDKKLYQETGRLYIPAEDDAPQAVIIVDSYPAMLPEKQDVDDPSGAMAIQARFFSENISRVKGKMKNKMMTVIGINQLRLNPGARFGNPEYEPGGQAIRYFCFHGNTYLFTDRGIIKGKDAADIEPKSLLGASGVEPINYFGFMGQETLTEIQTQFGFNLAATGSHRVKAHSNEVPDPEDDWVSMKDLTLQHKVALKAGANVWSEQPADLYGFRLSLGHDPKNDGIDFDSFPQQMNPDLARFMGLLIGNMMGTVSPKAHIANCVAYDNLASHPQEIVDIENLVYKLFSAHLQNNPVTIYSFPNYDNGKIRYSFSIESSAIYKFLKYCGVYTKDDGRLVVPWSIMESDFDCVRAFVVALLDARNGLLQTGSSLNLTLHESHDELVRALHIILLNAGVLASYELFWGSKLSLMGLNYAKYKQVFVENIPNPSDDNLRYQGYIDEEPYIWLPIKEIKVRKYPESTFDGNMPSHTIVTNGIVSHNSDARIRCAARANPYASGPFENEPSVLNSNEDTYRYVMHQAIKNKLGTPQLENWARLWIADGEGNAWGFDPVYDTFMFLSNIGFITGTRKKMVMNAKIWDITDLKLKWNELKLWILGTPEQAKEVCKDLGIKPFNLRKACFTLMQDNKEMIFENWFKGQAEEEDDEDEEDMDDED